MSADKVPCLVITKVSPEIIKAWKNPKKLKWTSLNQFKRCAQYYIEATITNVLPSIKNTEHFTSLEQADDIFKNRPKALFEEAREFLGNVELTKRTRGQQKQINIKVETTPSTSSAIIQVSPAAKRKRSDSLEHRVKRNDRRNSLISPNNSKPNDKGCNVLTIAVPINKDIVDKSVEPIQTLSYICNSPAIHSATKKCTTPVKVNPN